MSFRINQGPSGKTDNPPKKSIDVDLIDAKYKQSKLKKTEEPVNPVLTDYKKNLLKESEFKRQRIIYDKTTSKWKIITE